MHVTEDCRVALLSITAGGTGLTLTAARSVYILFRIVCELLSWLAIRCPASPHPFLHADHSSI